MKIIPLFFRPTPATNGVIKTPVNLFAGRAINSNEKKAREQFMICSPLFDTRTNNGITFKEAKRASVKVDTCDPEKRSFYNESTVLTEHAFRSEGPVIKGD